MTKAQMKVYDAIRKHHERFSYAPTFAEIADMCRLKSLGTVAKHITALKLQGYVAAAANRARDLQLTGKRPGYRKTLIEALKEAGPERAVRRGTLLVNPGCTFARHEILMDGWEVADGTNSDAG